MALTPVSSSNLVAVGYDSSTKILTIQFKNEIYEYYNVPSHVHFELMNAPSHGEYHAAHIKDFYSYRKVR
ncbi:MULTISPECIES: KTSC domain-containing protein [unclassified Priestia]|uniref:KTSC domain-containing protein n=1 Tax=unclassified Priestia TaxID=2800374 RepID=UPI0036711E08